MSRRKGRTKDGVWELVLSRPTVFGWSGGGDVRIACSDSSRRSGRQNPMTDTPEKLMCWCHCSAPRPTEKGWKEKQWQIVVFAVFKCVRHIIGLAYAGLLGAENSVGKYTFLVLWYGPKLISKHATMGESRAAWIICIVSAICRVRTTEWSGGGSPVMRRKLQHFSWPRTLHLKLRNQAKKTAAHLTSH